MHEPKFDNTVAIEASDERKAVSWRVFNNAIRDLSEREFEFAKRGKSICVSVANIDHLVDGLLYFVERDHGEGYNWITWAKRQAFDPEDLLGKLREPDEPISVVASFLTLASWLPPSEWTHWTANGVRAMLSQREFGSATNGVELRSVGERHLSGKIVRPDRFLTEFVPRDLLDANCPADIAAAWRLGSGS